MTAQTQTALVVQPLDQLAKQINTHHKLVKQSAQRMLIDAQVAGECLLHAKKQCPHGTFKQWVENNCAVSYATAREYMRVAKYAASKMMDLHHFDGGIRAFLDAQAKNKKPKPSQDNLPEFTKEDAEYAQKIAARMDSDFEGEREVAKAKLERFAESFGMTAEEVLGKAEEVNPHADLTAHEAKNQAIKEEVLAPFRSMNKDELLEIIFELLRRNGSK